MRSLSLLALAISCSFSLSSCGLLAHQTRNVKNLLTAPFRAELDVRFLDGLRDLERDYVLRVAA